jgi:hypothetical protein
MGINLFQQAALGKRRMKMVLLGYPAEYPRVAQMTVWFLTFPAHSPTR